MLFERENDEARVYKKRNKNETTASPSANSSELILTGTPSNPGNNKTTGDFVSEGNKAEKAIHI